MPAVQIKWSELLHLTELEFIPEAPKILKITDELIQAISWLTAATGHDRKLLRCDNNGALLVCSAWSLLSVVDSAELYAEESFTVNTDELAKNKGVLVSTSSQLVLIGFQFSDGGVVSYRYVSPNTQYWFAYPVYKVYAKTVPYSGGTASYIGVDVFG